MPNLPEEEILYKEDVLQIVFNELKDLKNQQLSQLLQTSEHLWGSLNFSMIIFGIYISSYLFLFTPGNMPSKPTLVVEIPLFLSIIYILIAVTLCVIALFPTEKFKNPHENSIYGLLIDEKEEALKKLADTYYIGYKDIRIRVQECNTFRKEVMIVTLASVAEFILFALTFPFKKHVITFVTISIIFSIIFEIILIKFFEYENKRIDLLRDE